MGQHHLLLYQLRAAHIDQCVARVGAVDAAHHDVIGLCGILLLRSHHEEAVVAVEHYLPVFEEADVSQPHLHLLNHVAVAHLPRLILAVVLPFGHRQIVGFVCYYHAAGSLCHVQGFAVGVEEVVHPVAVLQLAVSLVVLMEPVDGADVDPSVYLAHQIVVVDHQSGTVVVVFQVLHARHIVRQTEMPHALMPVAQPDAAVAVLLEVAAGLMEVGQSAVQGYRAALLLEHCQSVVVARQQVAWMVVELAEAPCAAQPIDAPHGTCAHYVGTVIGTAEQRAVDVLQAPYLSHHAFHGLRLWWQNGVLQRKGNGKQSLIGAHVELVAADSRGVARAYGVVCSEQIAVTAFKHYVGKTHVESEPDVVEAVEAHRQHRVVLQSGVSVDIVVASRLQVFHYQSVLDGSEAYVSLAGSRAEHVVVL